MCSSKKDFDKKKMLGYKLACVFVSCLVPLSKGGATVGTPSLTQCEAEEDAEGEEDDGTQYPQAGEVVLQDSNPETQTGENTGHRFVLENNAYIVMAQVVFATRGRLCWVH